MKFRLPPEIRYGRETPGLLLRAFVTVILFGALFYFCTWHGFPGGGPGGGK